MLQNKKKKSLESFISIVEPERSLIAIGYFLINIVVLSVFFGCALINIERLADDNITELECKKIIKSLTINIDNNSDAWKEYYYRGIAYFRIGEIELALNDITKSITINPKYASSYFSRGSIYITMKKYNEAMLDMNNAININPGHFDVYHMRGRIHYLLKNYSSSLMEYDNYIKYNDSNLNVQRLKVLCLYKLNNIDEAINVMKAVIEKENTFENAYILGVMYSAAKKYEEALNYYNDAIKLNNTDANIYNSRGLTYCELKKREEAIIDFTTAIQLSKSNISAAKIFFNRSTVHDSLENYNEAINDLNKAIEINNNYKNAYVYRSEIYTKLAKQIKDTAMISTFIERAEKDISISKTLEDTDINDNDPFSLDISLSIWNR